MLAPPRRLVIGATAHAELVAWLAERRPDLEIRGARHTEVTAESLDWGEAYLGFRRPLTPTLGSIRWVHCTGAGVDSWLRPVELDRGILLTRSSESFGPMIAEWVLSRMLAVTQHLREFDEAQRSRSWAPREPRRLVGTRALLVGMGDVGRATARLLRACGVTVAGASRSGVTESPDVHSMHAISALPALVGEADWIIVTLPLTRETEGLFSRELMAACRGAVLFNTGRGAVIDEDAIPDALDRGWLSGAALDVFAEEPLPPDSRLWNDPRVMVSPHVSGLTTIAGAGEGFLACLADVERGQMPRWTVDRERGY